MSTATKTQDPILSAFEAEQQRQKEIADLMKKREPLVVTLTKRKTEFEKAQEALSETEGSLTPINERLTVLLGVSPGSPPVQPGNSNGSNGHKAAAPAATKTAAKVEASSPMHEFITQAILDKGPMEVSALSKAITELGLKSNAKDLNKVVAQTLEVDGKKHNRFAIFGSKKPRGNQWTLGKGNHAYDMLAKDHR